jgi:hypothetical protein
VIAVTGAEGVVAGLRAETIAVFGDEGVAREELEAVAERRATTVREQALNKRGRRAGVVGGYCDPCVVTEVAREGRVPLPEEERAIPRSVRRGSREVRLDSGQEMAAGVGPRDTRPGRLEET